MMVELKLKRINDMALAKRRKGEDIQSKLTPQLRIAVISLLRERRPRVSRVATRTANGATWKEIEGIFSAKYNRIGRMPDS